MTLENLPSPATQRVVPSIGIHRDVPFAEYCQWDAFNFHSAVHYARSPMYARHCMIRGEKESSGFPVGDAAHAAILQPHVFDEKYVASPNFGDMRSASRRAQRDAFIAEQEKLGKIVITHDEHRKAVAIVQSLLRDPLAAEVLFNGHGINEISIVWEEEGVLCKGRIDRLTTYRGESIIVDPKTTKNPAHNSFVKDASNYNYIAQLATYRGALNILKPHARKCLLIAVENTEPYEPSCYWLDNRDLDRGHRAWKRWLLTHKQCVAEGKWPAANVGGMELVVPKYLTREYGDGD